MSGAAEAAKRWRAGAWTIAAAVVLLFAGANAHLIYVAVTSQPACIPHVRLGEPAAPSFSAAQSACQAGRNDGRTGDRR
jgi:hypothetical protein